jgi:hypothetical protein|tara:strand:+ start:19850 stop:20161 length:312 start_codon:yes stop_codon:yes gene_type:complete
MTGKRWEKEYIDIWALDGNIIDYALSMFEELRENYPDGIICVDAPGYDGRFELHVKYTRPETEKETAARLRKAATTKANKEKAEAKKEQREIQELERLKKKYE